jgi:hypothetical protein
VKLSIIVQEENAITAIIYCAASAEIVAAGKPGVAVGFKIDYIQPEAFICFFAGKAVIFISIVVNKIHSKVFKALRGKRAVKQFNILLLFIENKYYGK